MGRHSPSPSGPLARAHPPDPWTTQHPLSSISGTPSSSGRGANLSRNRMGTSHMGCHSSQPNPSTRPATSTSRRTLRQRVATQSLHHSSCTFKGRTFHRPTTSQPSTRHLPIRPFCEPSIHNHPLHQRLRIPIPPFLLLRRLRLPLPLFARTCRSGAVALSTP